MAASIARTVLQLHPPARAVIEKRAGSYRGQPDLSVAANAALTRYDALMGAGLREAAGELEPEDWNLLRAILNGSLYDHPDAVWQEVIADVEDADPEEFPGVEDLRLRLRRLSPLALYAVADAVETWWRTQSGGNR